MSLSENIKAEIARSISLNPAQLKVKLRKPLDFQSNRLYDLWADGRHFIVKEFLKVNELEAAPLREYKALCLLSAYDIAPLPVFFEPSLGPFVVYEYMEGEMWDRRKASRGDLFRLAEVWLKMNYASADWKSRGYETSFEYKAHELELSVREYLDWTMAEFKSGQRAAELCLETIERRRNVVQELSGLEPVFCFCKADPRFANVIERPGGRLGLVDWEDSGLRDPARDAADVITHPNQEDLLDWEEWQAFLKPYLDVRSMIDRNIEGRIHLYLAVFPIFWLSVLTRRGVRLAHRGELGGWKVNGLDLNLRLRRYLARGLAWPEMDYRDALDYLEKLDFFRKEAHEHMKDTIRKAILTDIPLMVELSEQKRVQYQNYQTDFWRKAKDSRKKQTTYFEEILPQEDVIALVFEQDGQLEGFVIAVLRLAPPVYEQAGFICMIDDFCVAKPDQWSNEGNALLQAALDCASEKGAVQALVVSGNLDRPKREMLGAEGFSLASEWYVRKINGTR